MYSSNYHFPNHANNPKLHNNQYSTSSSFKHINKTPNYYQHSYNTSTNNPEKSFKLNPTNIDTSPQYFEIFNLKIPFEDLLIICVLLFLFEEGIQDSYLFIALILLLLS